MVAWDQGSGSSYPSPITQPPIQWTVKSRVRDELLSSTVNVHRLYPTRCPQYTIVWCYATIYPLTHYQTFLPHTQSYAEKKIKPQFLFCLNLVFKPGIFRSKKQKKARDFCWKQLFSSGGCFFLFFSSFWIYFLARTPLLFVKKKSVGFCNIKGLIFEFTAKKKRFSGV